MLWQLRLAETSGDGLFARMLEKITSTSINKIRSIEEKVLVLISPCAKFCNAEIWWDASIRGLLKGEQSSLDNAEIGQECCPLLFVMLIPKTPNKPMASRLEMMKIGRVLDRIITSYYTFNFGSTRFSSTAFVATIIDEADIKSAANSGRSDQPKEV